MNVQVDRRQFLRVLSKAAAASIGASTADQAALAAPAAELYFEGWGGGGAKKLEKYGFEPYQDQTKTKVTLRSFSDEAGLLKRIQSSMPGEFHLVHSFGIENYLRYFQIGKASQINEANIPNLSNVMPALIAPLRKLNGKLTGVPINYSTTGIAYNKKYISDQEATSKGAALLQDSKYSAKIGHYDDMVTRVWYAALQTNQNPNSISDLGAIWDNLKRGKNVIKQYWRSGAELAELLLKEEIVVADAWADRIGQLQRQGHPIGFINPPGALAWMENIVVVAGAPQAEAEQLCNFLLDPICSIALAELLYCPPSLDPTKVRVTDRVKKLPGFDASGKLSDLSFTEPTYWAGKYADWLKQWRLISQGA